MFKKVLQSLFDTSSEDDKTINILMVGASGVGKTSTLTAMYDKFNKVINENIALQLIPDDSTSNKLNKKLIELKKQIATDLIRTRPTLAGTKDFDEFKFIIAKDEDSKQRVNLVFKDFPGGYLETERKTVKAWIKESDVIIIPIDTPSLIEKNSIYNEEANAPEKLYDIFKSIKGSFEEKNRLILFVPLKSEKYLDGNLYFTNSIRDLIEREFSNLISLFKSESLKDKTSLVITSIQTIGDIKFSMVEKDIQNRPVFVYKKKGFGSKYNPIDTEQPLKYILSFAISEVLKKRGTINQKISNMFNLDSDFIEALHEFSKDYKQDHNFVILQGEDLLKPLSNSGKK
jgi:GTPase SAR1 family protein